MEKIMLQTFRDLHAWQQSHELVLCVYKFTKNFPREELFGLTNQMRRAAVSITSNIAEGFGRRGQKEKVQFYYIAKGSLNELKSQLLLARDLDYLEASSFIRIMEQAERSDRILQGLITKVQSFIKK